MQIFHSFDYLTALLSEYWKNLRMAPANNDEDWSLTPKPGLELKFEFEIPYQSHLIIMN